MDLVKLTETLIKELVNDPEEVSVKEFESDDENNIIRINRGSYYTIYNHDGTNITGVKSYIDYATNEEAKTRLNINGKNEIQKQKKPSFLFIFYLLIPYIFPTRYFAERRQSAFCPYPSGVAVATM